MLRIKLTALGLAAGWLFAGSATAQEKEPEAYGIFANQEQYHQFMGSVKTIAREDPEMQAMVGLINDIALGHELGTTSRQYKMADSTMGLLSRPDVRKDIEMIDDQYRRLKDLASDLQGQAGDKLRALNYRDPEQLLDAVKNIRRDAQRQLEGLLLPHQLLRLRQIRTRSQLQRQSLIEWLTRDPVKSELSLSDQQAAQLREDAEKIDQELAVEISKLREAARQKLLQRLSPTQQSQVEELLGDDFSFVAGQPEAVLGGKREGAKAKRDGTAVQKASKGK